MLQPSTPSTPAASREPGIKTGLVRAGKIIAQAVQVYRQDLAVATSFGPEGIIILYLLSQIDPAERAPVLIFTIDTDLFFPETLALRDQLQTRFQLNIEVIHCGLSLEKQAEQYGERLWERDPDLCCSLRKVAPLKRALAGKRAWMTGVRREQTPARAGVEAVEWDAIHSLVKINPLADWPESQVWETIRANRLPVNPLHRRGYPSIGCQPCTIPVEAGEPPRSGRWVGFDKTECGLHMKTGNGG